MIIPIWRAKIEDGKIRVMDKDNFRLWAQNLKGELRFQLWPKSIKRSQAHNRRWHGVVCKVFGDSLGLTTDEACQELKRLVGRPWYYEKNGKMFFKSSATATQMDMNELDALACIKAAEQGIVIPTSDKITYVP